MTDTIEGLADAVSQSAPNEFSTQVHVADKNGPKNNKDGSYRKKKGDSKSTVDIPDEISPTPPAFTEMGNVMAITITSSFTMLFGNEWKPESNETEAMTMAWAKYFEATGVSEFPPWLMLAMVHTGYVGRRLAMPETRTRMQRLSDAFKRWRYARTNRGYDMQREDYAGNQPIPDIQA